jgi:hypothetical protein
MWDQHTFGAAVWVIKKSRPGADGELVHQPTCISRLINYGEAETNQAHVRPRQVPIMAHRKYSGVGKYIVSSLLSSQPNIVLESPLGNFTIQRHLEEGNLSGGTYKDNQISWGAGPDLGGKQHGYSSKGRTDFHRSQILSSPTWISREHRWSPLCRLLQQSCVLAVINLLHLR